MSAFTDLTPKEDMIQTVNSMKYNIGIVGLSRSGKTMKSKEFFEDFTEEGTCIFINSQGEDYFTGYKTIRNVIDFDINDSKVVCYFYENSDLILLINKLFQIQKEAAVPKPIRLIIDEVFLYQELPNAKKTLTKLIVDGLKWRIQTIITMHYPQMVVSTIYKNIHVFFIFRLNDSLYDHFKKTWRVNLFKYKDYLVPGKYNYVYYNGSDIYTKDEIENEPVIRQTASKKTKHKTIAEILREY